MYTYGNAEKGWYGQASFQLPFSFAIENNGFHGCFPPNIPVLVLIDNCGDIITFAAIISSHSVRDFAEAK